MFLSIKFYLAFFGPCFQSIDPDFVEQQFGVIHNFYTQAIPRWLPMQASHQQQAQGFYNIPKSYSLSLYLWGT